MGASLNRDEQKVFELGIEKTRFVNYIKIHSPYNSEQ
jgi:hypothetical protein